MRVFIMAAVLCLGLSAPGQAGPITLEFRGVIDFVDGAVATYVAPGLAIGDLFTVAVDFYADPLVATTNVAVSIGSGISGSSFCPICRTSLLDDMAAVSLYTLGGSLTGGVLQSLFSLSLGSGWQTGSMSVFLENVFIGGPVTGRITSMQVVPATPIPFAPVTRVPEPGSVLSLTLGICALAVVRRRLSKAAAA